MGNAGRVLMIPKGDYNAATTYEMLDCVYYQGRSYVCKQTSTGNAPTNTTYWQVMTPDASAEIQALTNYVLETGVKNILPYEGSLTVPTSNTAFSYVSNEIYFKEGTQLIFSCKQETALTSVNRNTLFVRRSSTSTTAYESTSSNYHLNAGNHIYNYTIPADGLYRFGIWCDTPNTDCAYSEFMLRDATITDPTYQPYAMTNQELTDAKIDASQIAPIENGATASTSYAQGAYFIHNGKFCKAKTSISSGATFTKGTNYEETTVAAELIALA